MKTNTSKKKLIAIYLLSLFIGVFMSSCVIDPYEDNRRNDVTASEDFSFRIDIKDQRRLELYGINGAIEIYGTAQNLDFVEIRGVKKVDSDSRRDAEDFLRDVAVEITNQSDRIIVRTDQPAETRGRNVAVDYHICIPGNWRVTAENANGIVRVDSVANDVAVYLTNGELTLGVIDGDVDANLTNGNIFLKDVFGSAKAESVNGNIDAQVILPPNGEIRMGTTNGNVALSIPANTSADFSASTTNGGVSMSGLFLHNSRTSTNSMSGTLGTGDGGIVLGSVNGSIQVRGF